MIQHQLTTKLRAYCEQRRLAKAEAAPVKKPRDVFVGFPRKPPGRIKVLTPEQEAEIRATWANRVTQLDLARKYGCSKSTINDTINGKKRTRQYVKVADRKAQ